MVLVKAIAMNDDDNRLFRGPLTEFREEIGNEFPTAGLLVCSIDEVEAEMMDVAGFFSDAQRKVSEVVWRKNWVYVDLSG